jgi:purine-nucleoside/S-methyl-5'-thioadenosine phosphorylase / adenosine deaminase
MNGAAAGERLEAVRVPAFEAVPGLVHGFERRLPAASPESREETRRRVAAALRENGRLLSLKQVHGVAVAQAPFMGTPEADAAVATAPGLILGIETADCLPVLLVDPRRRFVAAAHAGWRGTAAGVAAQAVSALRAHGARPEDLLAALGPAIGPCCYEVGDELREAFGPQGEAFFRPGPRGRPHLDVRALNLSALEHAGIPRERIHSVDECTSCRGDLYYSYRRDGAGAGRMISFVGFAVA